MTLAAVRVIARSAARSEPHVAVVALERVLVEEEAIVTTIAADIGYRRAARSAFAKHLEAALRIFSLATLVTSVIDLAAFRATLRELLISVNDTNVVLAVAAQALVPVGSSLEAILLVARASFTRLTEHIAVRITLLARLQIVAFVAALLVDAAGITLVVDHEVAWLARLADVVAAILAAVVSRAFDAAVLRLRRVRA